MSEDPITVSVRRATQLTGLSRTTLWRWIGEKQLKAKTVGGRCLIEYKSLRALVTAGDNSRGRAA